MKVLGVLSALAVVLLLSLPVVVSLHEAPMDAWKIVELEIRLDIGVKEGIIGATEYAVRDLMPKCKERALILYPLYVTGKEGEKPEDAMISTAKKASEGAPCARALLMYDTRTGGCTTKEEGATSPLGLSTAASPPFKVGIGLWSKYELSEEAEEGIRGVAQQLVEERINVEGLGGVAAECYVLKREGEWYTVYMRVFGMPPPEPLGSRAMAWEATFKYNPTQGAHEVVSFSEVDDFLASDDVKRRAVAISEKDVEIRAFVVENAKNGLSSQADWISKREEVVRLQYTVVLTLNETHILYRSLTAYIDLRSEEVLYAEKLEEVWCAPTPPTPPIPEPAPAPITNNVTASTPIEFYYGLSAVAVALAVGILLVVRKLKS